MNITVGWGPLSPPDEAPQEKGGKRRRENAGQERESIGPREVRFLSWVVSGVSGHQERNALPLEFVSGAVHGRNKVRGFSCGSEGRSGETKKDLVQINDAITRSCQVKWQKGAPGRTNRNGPQRAT